jgi:hypothetical protein
MTANDGEQWIRKRAALAQITSGIRPFGELSLTRTELGCNDPSAACRAPDPRSASTMAGMAELHLKRWFSATGFTLAIK